MATFRLNDAEQNALQELTWRGHIFASLMYLHEFRRRMDFKTCTVGATEHSTVREDFLAACVELRPVAGSHYKPKTHKRDFVQKQIKRLVEVGLLRRLEKASRRAPMKFFFPLAAGAPVISSQEVGTVTALSGEHYAAGCGKPKAGEALRSVGNSRAVDNMGGGHYPKKGGRAHILDVPEYNYQNQNIPTRAKEDTAPVDNCHFEFVGVNRGGQAVAPIDRNWVPDVECVNVLASKHGVETAFVLHRAKYFRFYWLEHGGARTGWNAQFMSWFNRGADGQMPEYRMDLESFQSKSAVARCESEN